jgi:fructose 1,6-bisphosphate aldolase/phosphatase
VVTCAAFAVHEGKLTEPVDVFDDPFWDAVHYRLANKAMEIRKQGFFGSAMLSMSELEYTGIAERLERLDGEFSVRGEKQAAVASL